MPNLDLIPVNLYQPTDAYNSIVDNRPLLALITRIDLVNYQVDIDANTLRQSIGSAGSLSNRLAQSINDDGSLKSVAIDNALHNIADHLDGGGYVRMTNYERCKLSLIADEATNFGISINTISGIIDFDQSYLQFAPSDTITWRYTNGFVYADNAFPSSVRHVHYYSINPIPVNLITPDYISYYTTSIATPYAVGSLRVYLNGVRLSPNDSVNVPIYNGTTYVPTAYSYSEDTTISNSMVTTGLFYLSSAINSNIMINIDFNIIY